MMLDVRMLTTYLHHEFYYLKKPHVRAPLRYGASQCGAQSHTNTFYQVIFVPSFTYAMRL